jgi:zinc protease
MPKVQKSQPANSSQGSTFPGPDDITRVQLPNKIVVLSRANFNSPSVVVRGYLPAGSLFDPEGKLGLADFTVSALMRGTEIRTFGEIYNALETAGASLSLGGATHTIGFYGRALVEDFDLLLSLLAEVLRQPSFPKDQVERLRAQLLTSLALRAQSTSEMASLTFDQIIYNGHPYSRPEDGYPETIQAIERADLEKFHKKHYGPKGLVISVVGAVDSSQAVDKVAQYLGDWQNVHQPEPPPLPKVSALEQVHTQQVSIPGKSQADVVLGVAGPPRKSSNFLAAALGNNILGQFGMMGRIGEVVREKAGLAYYASSSLSAGVGPGPWYVSAGVAPGDVREGIELIINEITRFISEPVREEELADSQANFIGRLPLSLESNAGVAAALTNLERYQLGLDYYNRYPDLVRSIMVEDVLETAQQFLDPNRLGIAIAGPL